MLTCTQPGDVVFDPFAGYGTTIVVADRLGRIGHGVEIDAARAAAGGAPRVVIGDVRDVPLDHLPPIALVYCSPPYTNRDDSVDPLNGWQGLTRGYDTYLRDMTALFERLSSLLKPDGRIVLELENLRDGGGGWTLLAWDVARALSDRLIFHGETIIDWVERSHLTYCLEFVRPA